MKIFNKKTDPNSKIEDAILVHKLKHGLSTIKWSLRMLLSGDFGEVTEEEKVILRKSIEENEQLILLADSLLDNKENKKNKNFLNQELCDLEKIVGSVIESYKSAMEEKNIELEFIRPREKMEAFLDKEKISIAVQNILDNAVRYTQRGDKMIISLNKIKDNLELKIQDSGMGIPENQKEKMFTKFFRADNVKGKDDSGSGLGLFITKNIIEAHGGKIWFESKENIGSTFYISLPIKSVDFDN